MGEQGEQEGVIKFSLNFQPAKCLNDADVAEINAWRQVHWRLGLIGQDAARYQGYGFGNISQRWPDGGASNRFIVSGTQTGGRQLLTAAEYALVSDCDPSSNTLRASGQIKPSSEAMTHGQLYQLSPLITCVIHVHSPEIWHAAEALRLPFTQADVPYGTPAMAAAVADLFNAGEVMTTKLFTMAGHEDGVVAFGEDFATATAVLVNALAAAFKC